MNENFFVSFFRERRVQPSPNFCGYRLKFERKIGFQTHHNKIELCRLFFTWLSVSKYQKTMKKHMGIISLQNNKHIKKEYFYKFVNYYYNCYINTCIYYNDHVLNVLKLWNNENYNELTYLLRLFVKDKRNKELEHRLDDVERQLNCCVCFQVKKNVLFSPCNHAVCCKECSVRVDRCPICKAEIQSTTKIFL